MKKSELEKSVGHRFRLQPVAKGPEEQTWDDDWLLQKVNDKVAILENTRTKNTALIGLDSIYSRFSDPGRDTATETYAFLQLHAQVQVATDGKVTVTPLPPPRTASPGPQNKALQNKALVDALKALNDRGLKLWATSTFVLPRWFQEVDAWSNDVANAVTTHGGTDNDLRHVRDLGNIYRAERYNADPEIDRRLKMIDITQERIREVIKRYDPDAY